MYIFLIKSISYRVNCEAIPEEMGTTPPTADTTIPTQHTLLLAPAQVDHRKMSAPAVIQDWHLTQADKSSSEDVRQVFVWKR